MEMDFSNLNLQYLLQVRDIAKKYPELAATLLGLPMEIVNLLSIVTVDALSKIALSTAPLIKLRGEPWWWSNLLTALKDHQLDEAKVVLEHANLALVVSE